MICNVLYVMCCPTGIVAASPFQILGEYGPPVFQRGLLHVYMAKLQLHILVTHLHAHSSSQREMEATFIGETVVNGIRKNYGDDARIVLMGDLNTLSRVDSRYYYCNRQQFTAVDIVYLRIIAMAYLLALLTLLACLFDCCCYWRGTFLQGTQPNQTP